MKSEEFLQEVSLKKWWVDSAKFVRNAVIVGFFAVLSNFALGWGEAVQTRWNAIPFLVTEVEQIRDELDSQREDTTAVVVWASSASQALTESLGPCDVDGEEVCYVGFRGRRTLEGLECAVVGADLKIEYDGSPVSLMLHESFKPVKFGLEFENVILPFTPSRFIPDGGSSVFVVTMYENCGFARPGETVKRQTIRVVKEFI